MTLLQLPSKTVAETIPITFNFSDKLQFGETVTGSAVACSVFSGTDPSPTSMVGAITNSGTSVSVIITGGIVGNLYLLVCVVTASGSHNYSKEGRLAVIAPGGNY
jgi:hypothetical protein